MANYTIYRRVKTEKGWRYQRAAFHSNGKIINDGTDGKFYFAHEGKWIPAGTHDALKAQSKRLELIAGEIGSAALAAEKPAEPTLVVGRMTLKAASEKYFSNLEAQGKDLKTIRTYRAAVDPFVANCKTAYVEDVTKQDLIDYMGFLRKQPVPVRKHGNPNRTYANKIGHCAIFLKAFGVTKLLKKSEYPKFHQKKIVAHTDEELALLYQHANDEERFLLDFFIGTMARDAEAHKCKYRDLTGTTLTLYGKQNKTRTVEISPRLAASIAERRKTSKHELLFVNGEGNPNQHLLRDLQDLAKRAGAKFHCELHKLRKTGASRRYAANPAGLTTLMYALGHNSLSTTQVYLADVTLNDTKKAVAAADFIPKLKIVRTGTDGD
jgi:integrase